MSTEGPNIKSEQKKEIPFDWFIGVGRKDLGIKTVGFSPTFYKLGEQKIKEMGFTMEELEAKKRELEEKYKGKKNAKEIPFEFKLLDGVLI
ncbi:hypothetical protein KKG24_03225 [Patescibacteria group bacterium]|nr:hypothetical protein [Patescibacteria group bacterium]